MTLTKENCTRKIDSLGRVSLPKSVRDRLGFAEGLEIEFFTLVDGNDQYICAKSPLKQETNDEELAAIALLESMGYQINGPVD